MCGVWAQVQSQKSKKEAVDLPHVRHAVEQLAHRGPDDYSWFADDSVSLVHTRLSIIDLSGGRQPLLSYDGKWIGIVNGELYDYQALREKLENRGATFKTHSDSEVLLNAFAMNGASALEDLSGEFAFIFYNPSEQRMVFGRDLSGVKPLFIKKTSAGIEVASEMKAMVRETPEIHIPYIENLLARVMLPPQTAIEGIEHVLPGRIYTLNTQTLEVQSRVYRALPLFNKREARGTDTLPALEHELKQAVKRRLVADVPVGCYLSGGIDSSLLTALAVENGAKPKTFTVTFADKELDESSQANEVAQHLGLESHFVEFNKNNFLPSLIDSVIAFENPITNPHGAAKNILSAEARKHVKVVLTGEGADEIFGGYPYFRHWKSKGLLERHPNWGLAVDALAHSELGEIERLHLSRYDDSNKNVEMFDRMGADTFLNPVLGLDRREFLHRAHRRLNHMIAQEFPNVENTGAPEFSWDRLQYASFRMDLLHYILSNVGDRQEMSHSIEGRTPFLDPEVIELACTIRPDHMVRGTQEKSLLKRLARTKLPPSIWHRKKQAFFAPLKYLFNRDVRNAVGDYAQLCRNKIPGLRWDAIDAFVKEVNWSGTHPSLDNFVLVQLVMLSTGVLLEQLGKPKACEYLRYSIPQNAQDLEAHRFRIPASPGLDRVAALSH